MFRNFFKAPTTLKTFVKIPTVSVKVLGTLAVVGVPVFFSNGANAELATSLHDKILEQDLANFVATFVDPDASRAAKIGARMRVRHSSAQAVASGSKQAQKTPECTAFELHGKRIGKSGDRVFLEDCLGLSVEAVINADYVE